ncbi:hypothetical protein O3M35_008072 [Rhynocoris fuscipes]|uniref:Calcineurin-like phosphoesterase domain-containing protein n=1 Tax=Rhynocoris fuscipes TaxID=488301 RepID=A0AAW1DCJ5_9HEMI
MAIIKNGFVHISNYIFSFYRFFRRKYSYSVLLYLITLIVITNELIISSTYQLYWPNKTCGELKNYYKILMVADPQILGENTECWIARWDSDRFLRNSFSAALRYTQPDVIVFLGDLMDEGSHADHQQFSRYLSRFNAIFQHATIPTIFVPGDNDIGGEDEPVYLSNVQRFEQFFASKSDLEKYEHLEFYKVNKLLRRFPNISNIKVNSSSIRIAVSHIPLLGYADDTTEKVIKNLRPQLIFSAHDHKSIHFVGDLKTGETTFIEVLESNTHNNDIPSWRFQNGEMITNEIIVPTCSYRMGVQKIGYGLALIDKDGSYWCYMILWLPQRLHQLRIYFYSLILISLHLLIPFLFTFFKCFIRFCKKYSTTYTNI